MVDSREKREKGEVRCASKFWEGEMGHTLGWTHWSLGGAVHSGQLSCYWEPVSKEGQGGGMSVPTSRMFASQVLLSEDAGTLKQNSASPNQQRNPRAPAYFVFVFILI